MIRQARLLYAAAIAAAVVSPLQAATLYWQGGTGNLTNANYTDGTNMNLTPVAADIVNFGAGGTGTHTSGTASLSRLRVGHTQGTNNGGGTVTISNGAKLNLAGATMGGLNAGLIVNNNHANGGTMTITGSGSGVTVGRLVLVGYGANVNRIGTLNVEDSGFLTVTLGNLVVGETSGTTSQGNQGHVFVNGGTITLSENPSQIQIGTGGATSSFTQTSGSTTVGNQIAVGFAGTNSNSSFTLSGGTVSTGNGGNGNFVVGAGTTSGANATISGSGLLDVGNRYLMGSGDATDAVTNHSSGTVTIDLDLRLADTLTSPTAVATYNLSGSGILNTNDDALTSGTSTIIGRRGTGRFFQTGGTANFKSPLFIGNRDTGGTSVAANGLYVISAGTLNANSPSPTWANALSIAPNGTGELRVIGDDATIDVTGNFSISSTANGEGTLAYELQTGELVSVIDVSGTALFGLGSKLKFNTANAPMTQYVYDLLTATNITDLGIDFEGPAPNWYHRIVPGGNGFILQAVAPEPSAYGLTLLAAIAGLFRHRGR